MMIKRWTFLSCLCCCAFSAETQIARLYGRWKVVAEVASTDIVGMSNEEADALVGRYIYLGPKTFRFAGETCEPSYDMESMSLDEFERGAKLDKTDVNNLHLSVPVTIYRVGCADIFPTRSAAIILSWDGFFYRAVKVPASKAGNNPKFKDQHAAPQPQHSDH